MGGTGVRAGFRAAAFLDFGKRSDDSAVVVTAFALGHAHMWCGGLTRVWGGGFQNQEFV